jgi:hypothetical protein
VLQVRDRYQDPFVPLFGSGRGVPGDEREIWLPLPPPVPSIPLLQTLTGESALPVGLTLVMGEADSGRTSVCAMLATELKVANKRVLYLDCDRSRDITALLAAQMPKESLLLPPPVESPPPGKGFEHLQNYRGGPEPPSVIILDSLVGAAPAIPPPNNPGYYADVTRYLARFARENKLSIVVSCWASNPFAVVGVHAELALSMMSVPGGTGVGNTKFMCALTKSRTGNPHLPVGLQQHPQTHLLTVAPTDTF